MAVRLTKRIIDDTLSGPKDLYLWDISPLGFGVRIRPTGAKTFVFAYRTNGGRSAQKQRLSIGRYGTLTLEQARRRASELAGHVASGKDPAKERKAQRLRDAQEAQTFAVIASDFVERYAKPRLRRWPEYERILRKYVPPTVASLPMQEITRAHITELLDHVADNNGLVMADRVLAVLRKLFHWHEARDADFRTPIVKGLARTSARSLARDRILTDDEIRRLWNALALEHYPFRQIVQLLLLTGQRRDEVAGALWNEVRGHTWTIASARYKTGLDVAVPLSPMALEIVKQLPRSNDLLFTTSDTPFSGFSVAKARLDKASGIFGWRLHDLRRTAKTLMIRGGVRPDITERVLGHVIPGVAGVYDRHDYLEEKREALNLLAKLVQSILHEQPSTTDPSPQSPRIRSDQTTTHKTTPQVAGEPSTHSSGFL